jgi:hypothetical protein
MDCPLAGWGFDGCVSLDLGAVTSLGDFSEVDILGSAEGSFAAVFWISDLALPDLNLVINRSATGCSTVLEWLLTWIP